MQGRKNYQKLKPYLVLNYLMRFSDAEYPVPASEIVAFLEEVGISAERRSIYRDIEEINIALYLEDHQDSTLDEALDALNDESEKSVVYDASKKGFYVRNRNYELDDIRLLAECIYAAKFIDEKRANRLVDVIISLVSYRQATRIKKDVLLVDRTKTTNTKIYYNLSTINEAMSASIEGEKHIPEKISFKYLKYTIQNVKEQVEKRGGKTYIVSPYKLIINDGNYYLRAFSDEHKEMRTYRVDRMTDVRPTGIPKDGAEAFAAEKDGLKSYPQRVFSMFSGENVRVTIEAENKLLDAFIERFGTRGNFFRQIDEHHFQIDCNVEISDQFFGWLLGFGTNVKLLAPEKTVKEFKKYLSEIIKQY